MEHSFAIVTLCSGSDLPRCRLFRRTCTKYLASGTQHYIVVDRKDRHLFRPLEEDGVRLLCVEEILPWWIFRMPGARRWWMSFRTPPIRNWILQQLVKLSMPLHVSESVLVFADADVAFIKPWDPREFVQGGRVKLLRVPDANNTPMHQPWHRTAGKILGLPLRDYYEASYIGNLVPWRSDNVRALHRHIEKIHGGDWLTYVARQWHFSEYVLYGVFADKILGLQQSAHYYDDTVICLGYWEPKPLSEKDLRDVFSKIKPQHAAVMVSSKAGIPVDRYESILEEFSSPRT